MSLGIEIQDRRFALGLSVDDVAKKTGLSIGTVRAIEQGRRKPSVKSLKLFIEALDMTGSWFDRVTWLSSSGQNYSLAPVPGGQLRKSTQSILPRDQYGNIRTSAEFGELWLVRIQYLTDHKGQPIRVGEEEFPTTLHGPFFSIEEAKGWVDDYPDGDTDIHEIDILVMNQVRPA